MYVCVCVCAFVRCAFTAHWVDASNVEAIERAVGNAVSWWVGLDLGFDKKHLETKQAPTSSWWWRWWHACQGDANTCNSWVGFFPLVFQQLKIVALWKCCSTLCMLQLRLTFVCVFCGNFIYYTVAYNFWHSNLVGSALFCFGFCCSAYLLLLLRGSNPLATLYYTVCPVKIEKSSTRALKDRR